MEFVLLESTNPVRPSNVYQPSEVKGLLTGSPEAQILEEIADALMESGIQVETYHPEDDPGQVRSSL